MSAPPFQAGDFVWCAFPERENPAQPAATQHLGYILAVSRVAGTSQFAALTAYTTSKPWSGPTLPLGVRAFDQDAAEALGQQRPFLMDFRRLAFIPVTAAWFPRLDQPDCVIQGRAPQKLQDQLLQEAMDLLRRHRELIQRAGTAWPRRQQ